MTTTPRPGLAPGSRPTDTAGQHAGPQHAPHPASTVATPAGPRAGERHGTRAGDRTAERQTFELYGRRVTNIKDPEVQQLLAAAHADRVRPLCMCRPGGVAMYVAQAGYMAGPSIGSETAIDAGSGGYLIKRMPDSGLAHAHRCSSYLPPEELSGFGHVLGSAITEEADSGLTAVRLGFRMSKSDRAARAAGAATADAAPGSAAADPNRLTLRAVLHYLWQEAELATWTPGMEGKRSWRVVSWHLRQAARGKFTKGKPLTTRLYVPEPFTADRKTQIAARRLTAWAPLQHGQRASKAEHSSS